MGSETLLIRLYAISMTFAEWPTGERHDQGKTQKEEAHEVG
jgi:hypothetical protein